MIWKFLLFFTFSLTTFATIFAGNLMEYDQETIQEEVKEIEKQNINVPNREISIIAGPEGYYPEKISVFKGERVRFYITSTEKTPGCFLISDKEIFLSANNGRITEAEVKFDELGEVVFHCPTGNIRGKITVLDRPDKIRAARKIASDEEEEEAKPSYWIPREQ